MPAAPPLGAFGECSSRPASLGPQAIGVEGARRLLTPKSRSAVYSSFFYILSWKTSNIPTSSENCSHELRDIHHSASPLSEWLISLPLYPSLRPTPSKHFPANAKQHISPLSVFLCLSKISTFTRLPQYHGLTMVHQNPRSP